MKKLGLIAVVLFWSCQLFVRAADTVIPEKELSAAEIVQKSAQAYDTLVSYTGTTTVTSKAQFKTMRLNQKADARIQFSKPNKIRIEGHDSSNRTFTIISDGRKVWSAWELINDGEFEESPDMTKPLSSMTGVALGAPTHIASILMKLNWGYPTRGMENIRFLGREAVNGADCYKLIADTDTDAAIKTYWVDAKTFLLRRHKSEMDELRMVKKESRLLQKEYEEAQKNPDLQIKSMATTYTFTDENTNVPLNEALFANPLAAAAKNNHVENQANRPN